jgi:hypothetical protein
MQLQLLLLLARNVLKIKNENSRRSNGIHADAKNTEVYKSHN